MINFTLEYSKTMIFLDIFCFRFTKMLFSAIFYLFFYVPNFRDFPYRGKFATLSLSLPNYKQSNQLKMAKSMTKLSTQLLQLLAMHFAAEWA